MTIPKSTPSFTAKVRLLLRMQDILEARNTELADSVFNKIESTLQGERGIKYTAKEIGLKERVYELAKFQLAKEQAEFNLNAHMTE